MLDAAAIAQYVASKKQAMIICGAVDNPALDALMLAEAIALVALIKHADVLPTALPTPLTAPPGGGPVTGKGTLE